MKLSWQLLLIITLLLIAQLVGLTYLNIINTRISTQEQLTANAQNTADSLGFTLKKHLEEKDLPMLNTSVRAVFDNGYYQRIAVVDHADTILIEFVRQSQEIDQVPTWFSRLVQLTPPTVTANLMQSWQILGKIEVTASTDYMYIAQWRSLSRAFIWLVSITITISALLLILLHFILKPIYRTKAQAEAIMLGDFPIQTKIPFTQEFATVVKTMNNMVKRLRMVFERHAQLSEKLREQAYQDELTGLSNMRYFNISMDFLMSMRDEFIYGTFMLINIEADDAAQQSNAVKQLSNLIKQNLDPTFAAFGARLDVGTLAVLQPFNKQVDTQQICDQWLRQLQATFGEKIKINIGILGLAGYWQNETLEDVLSNARNILDQAIARGNYQFHYATLPGHIENIDIDSLLNQAMDDNLLEVIDQTVHAVGSDIPLHIESRLALPTEQVKIVTTRGLTAVADRNNRAMELDKLVIELLLNLSEKTASQHSHTLFKQSVDDPTFAEWLNDLFEKTADEDQRLCLQVTEYVAIHHTESCKRLAKVLQRHHVPFGLMRVGRDFGNFDHFRNLPINYVKINGTYIRGIDKNSENRAIVRELVYICHSLDIKVIATAVSTEAERSIVENLAVDGYIIRAEGV